MRKPMREVYPDLGEEPFYCYGSYYPLLQSFGYEIILQVDDSDYQGDSRILYRNQDQIGLLIFGWGSCSGCDALQACTTYQDIEDLADALEQKIIWKPQSEMLEYFTTHDWMGDFCWHEDETKSFIKQGITLLRKE